MSGQATRPWVHVFYCGTLAVLMMAVALTFAKVQYAQQTQAMIVYSMPGMTLNYAKSRLGEPHASYTREQWLARQVQGVGHVPEDVVRVHNFERMARGLYVYVDARDVIVGSFWFLT